MLYRNRMAESGNRLFRWRSYIPVFFFFILLLFMKNFEYIGHDHTLDLLWESVCLSVSFLGLAVRCFTIGFTPHHTSGRNTRKQVADSLNKTGLYSMVRNPLYLGNYIIWLGISMFLHDWRAVLLTTCIFWLYYERIVVAEEAFLSAKFGDGYAQWAEKTPVFIPKLSGYVHPENRFSFRKVIRKEYSGFFAIIITMFALETIGDFALEKEMTIDPFWLTLITSGTFLYVVIRMLKKKTRILK